MDYRLEPEIELDDTDPSIALPSAEDVHVQPELVNNAPTSQPPSDGDDQECLGNVDTDPVTQLPSSEGDQAPDKLIDTAPTVQQPLSEHDQARLPTNTGIQRKILRPVRKFTLEDAQMGIIMALMSMSAPPSNPVVGAPSSVPSPSAEPTPLAPSDIHTPTLDIAGMPVSTPSAPRKHKRPVTSMSPFYFTSQKSDAAEGKPFITPPPKPVMTPGAPAAGKAFVFTYKGVPGVIGAGIQSNVPQEKTATGFSLLLRREFLRVPHDTPESAIKGICNIICNISNQTKQASGYAAQSDSPLLKLPGELRNRIYRFAIIKPVSIELDIPRWQDHQPAFVRTCKQIRIEALRLFYAENKITTNIHDWNPIVKVRCSELLASHKMRSHHLYHYFTGSPNWENLLAWLKGVFEGKIGGISSCVGKTRTLERKVVGGMFMYVSTAHKGTDWPDLLPFLELQREVLGMEDPRWLL
jgi:hypothetical protein